MPASPSQFYLWAVPLLAANKRVITILRAIQLLIRDAIKYNQTFVLTQTNMPAFKYVKIHLVLRKRSIAYQCYV